MIISTLVHFSLAGKRTICYRQCAIIDPPSEKQNHYLTSGILQCRLQLLPDGLGGYQLRRVDRVRFGECVADALVIGAPQSNLEERWNGITDGRK